MQDLITKEGDVKLSDHKSGMLTIIQPLILLIDIFETHNTYITLEHMELFFVDREFVFGLRVHGQLLLSLEAHVTAVTRKCSLV